MSAPSPATENAPGFALRPGRPEDAPAIAALLRACSADCVAESEEWLRDRARFFQLALDEKGRVAASAALLPAGRHSRLLRSVAVRPEYRGTRLADRVLEPLLAEASTRRASVWCRTTRPGFFRRKDFREASRQLGRDGRARHLMVRSCGDEPAHRSAALPPPQRPSRQPIRPTPLQESSEGTQ